MALTQRRAHSNSRSHGLSPTTTRITLKRCFAIGLPHENRRLTLCLDLALVYPPDVPTACIARRSPLPANQQAVDQIRRSLSLSCSLLPFSPVYPTDIFL